MEVEERAENVTSLVVDPEAEGPLFAASVPADEITSQLIERVMPMIGTAYLERQSRILSGNKKSDPIRKDKSESRNPLLQRREGLYEL